MKGFDIWNGGLTVSLVVPYPHQRRMYRMLWSCSMNRVFFVNGLIIRISRFVRSWAGWPRFIRIFVGFPRFVLSRCSRLCVVRVCVEYLCFVGCFITTVFRLQGWLHRDVVSGNLIRYVIIVYCFDAGSHFQAAEKSGCYSMNFVAYAARQSIRKWFRWCRKRCFIVKDIATHLKRWWLAQSAVVVGFVYCLA